MNALIIRTRNRAVDLYRRIVSEERRPAHPAKIPVPEDAIPFQNGVDEVLEQRLPAALRPTTYFILVLFITLVIIAGVMDVDVVVTCSGRFVTDTPTIVLQPLDSALIRELNVVPGVRVTKGQVLATLDTTFTQADVVSLTAQQRSVRAQERRLEAELSDKPFDPGPNPTSDDLIQATLYNQREAEYKSRIEVFTEEISRLQTNLDTVAKDIELSRQQLAVSRDVESMRSALEKSQTGSRLQLLDAQSSRMRAERDYHDAVNRQIELQHGLESKRAEKAAFVNEWRRTLLESLVSQRTAAVNAGEGLTKASRLRDLVVITAPEDGVVQDVAKLSVGSVVRGAEPLVTIIPSRTKLIAEIMIASADMGFTKAGDHVVIKVDAFPYSRHGGLTGKLTSVSEDTALNSSSAAAAAPGGGAGGGGGAGAGGGAFYRGWVEILENKLERLPKGGRLISGMTLNAEIKVGTRTILSYFLSPISSGLGVSFREP
ncbi:MAG: HlyD family type I secretion periplasmic adaptor subunit [Rhodospirillaceae bacterium]